MGSRDRDIHIHRSKENSKVWSSEKIQRSQWAGNDTYGGGTWGKTHEVDRASRWLIKDRHGEKARKQTKK